MTRGRFQDKRVLITGGTSGIGRATALAFAEAGAAVVISGRDEGRGAEVAAAGAALPGSLTFLPCDVTDGAAVRQMVQEAVEHLGGLDVAFNNAGFQERRAALAEQTMAAYDRIFDTNLRALFLAMQAEIPVMLECGGGAIINNGSVSGVRNPNPGLALYSASKAAALSLTRSAALEYAGQGIRINAVSPGRVETPMMLASGVGDMAAVAAGLPAKRLGQPEEVAAAVLWLASDEASFVFGHNLCVDGGFLSA